MSSIPHASAPEHVSLSDLRAIVLRELRAISSRVGDHVSVDDLISVGLTVLVKLRADIAEDSSHSSAYYAMRVRGAMIDELRRHDPLSRRGRAQVKLLAGAMADLETRLGRVPRNDEIACELGVTGDAVRDIERLRIAAQAVCIDAESPSSPRIAGLVDAEARSPAEALEADEAVALVRSGIAQLTGRHHAHILQRYFLDEVTLDTIAAELGISKPRVFQIRAAAMLALRQILGG